MEPGDEAGDCGSVLTVVSVDSQQQVHLPGGNMFFSEGRYTPTQDDVGSRLSDVNSNPEVSTIQPGGDTTAAGAQKVSRQRKSPRSGASRSWEENREEKWLQSVEKKFQTIAGEDHKIDVKEFKQALQLKMSFFAERLFTLFDKDQSGFVELEELIQGLADLNTCSQEGKLKFLFDIYDVNGSGTIDVDELKTVLISCMAESSLQLDEVALDSLTTTLFQSADEDHSGEITFQELLKELKRHPGVLENLTISAVRWLSPPQTSAAERHGVACSRYFSRRYLLNNTKIMVFMAIYIFINIGLFLVSAIRYRKSNGFIIVARGCGMTLNFNSAFIVVPMLRSCLTWLRTTRAAAYLPLDDSILFHKVVGFFIAIFSLIHTVAHLGNIYVVVYDSPVDSLANTTAPLQYWQYLFTLKSGLGWVGPGFGFLSGVILFFILLIIVVCSLPFVRRGGHFQLFYWTHTLYVLYWVFCILHGPIFWYFFILPGFVFSCEMMARCSCVKKAKYGKMYIDSVSLLPSKVTHLVITRSDKFRFSPGDYVFLKIPELAAQEWHPFTISSAPELKDEFWLHIRSAGHWTNKLYHFFDNKLQNELSAVSTDETKQQPHNNHGQRKKKNSVELQSYKSTSDTKAVLPVSRRNTSGSVHVEVLINGPYGTASRDIFNSDHAVLIGSGIGVTPFAAILQSIMLRYQATKMTCPTCDHTWLRPETARFRTKKVDFIWITRDQRCFEWFVRLLAELEAQQAALGSDPENPFLELHLYITAAASRNDMQGLGLQMALELMHKKDNRDVITGLKTRTHAGRPVWSQVFQRLKEKTPGKVDVFFCGSPALEKMLADYCSTFSFSFHKEIF